MLPTRIMRPFLGLSLLLAVAVASPSGQAHVLIPLTVEQMTDASDYIVRGTVDAIWVDLDDRGNHWTRVQVEVDRVIKGPPDLDALQLDVMGGALNGEATIIAHTPRFSEQEEVLLFAELTKSGKLVPTGWSQGKYTIRIDPDDGREMLVRFNPAIWQPYDHRFIPHPPPADRVYLEDLLSQVGARMLTGWLGEPIPGKSMERLMEIDAQTEAQVQP